MFGSVPEYVIHVRIMADYVMRKDIHLPLSNI